MERFRRVGQTIQGKSVAFLGVVPSHRDEHRKAIEERPVPLRLWWDPENDKGFSPIGWAWLAGGEDTDYVLDKGGVIRYKLNFDHDALVVGRFSSAERNVGSSQGAISGATRPDFPDTDASSGHRFLERSRA